MSIVLPHAGKQACSQKRTKAIAGQLGVLGILLITPLIARGGVSQTGRPVTLDDGYGAAIVLTGDFNGDQKDDVLSYYVDSKDWVLHTYSGNRLQRITVGNTSAFGNLNDGRPVWSGDFNGDGRADVLFYSPGDFNWWLGTLQGSELVWSLVDSSSGFGNVWDGRPF